MRKLNLKKLTAALAVAFSVALPAAAQDASGPILFTNVNVFDGVNEALIKNANVVVTDNLITAVSTEPLAVAGGTVIDGGGRTMMPGMIDVHWHTYFANLTVGQLLNTTDMGDIAIAGLLGNEQVLMRGFTTVRDIGGNPFAVHKAIDAGKFPGPRMLVAGPPLGQTGGHFDLYPYNDVPRDPSVPLPYLERNGVIAIADGVPDVTRKAREILRMGATQIKIAVAAGSFTATRSARVDNQRAEEIVSALLYNVYRAFDFRDEEIIYDTLAHSVSGDFLTETYLETRRGLELASQGGARAKVQEIDVLGVTSESEGDGFRATATWNVAASVGHWGHIHQRRNQYNAELTVEAVDGVWKITGMELIGEERL